MQRDAFRPDRKLVVGAFALAAAGVTCFSPSAFSAERVVLGEYFTWEDCIYCPAAGAQINGMVTTYGADGTHGTLSGTLAVVEYNLWDSYQLPWGALRAQNFYNSIFQGTPCFVLDGLWDAYPTSTYVNKFLNRQAVDTPVTVGITSWESTPNRYDTTVTVCLEENASPVDLRVYTLVVEDHYPPIFSYNRNGFRTATPTTGISLNPGECAEVNNLIPIYPQLSQDYLKIVAWAQEPNASWPADVYQAGIDSWPFEPPAPDPCPWDCGNDDGEVGINDFLAMLADWGGPGPCDFDGNDVIDVVDFLELLANWGTCSP
jgi:hypothetical protein